MASIRKRVSAKGVVSYQANIVLKNHGEIFHRESQTFAKKKLAEDWAKRREIELQETGIYGKAERLELGELIQRYIDAFRPSGRSKNFDLAKLMTRNIARKNVHTLTAKDLIEHIQERNQECLPQTASNDLIWIGTIIKTMRGLVDLKTDPTIVDSARQVLRKEGLIARSNKRGRLPSKDEIIALSRHLHGTSAYECWWFALYSARRISEITRLEWADIDHDKKTILVRDLKHPTKKNWSKRCKLPASAYKIIMRQPKVSARIFPYNHKSIGTRFTKACKILGIQDLHFHDARHAATTALFNKGLSIQQVQQITLHSTWESLSIYCNMQPEDVIV